LALVVNGGLFAFFVVRPAPRDAYDPAASTAALPSAAAPSSSTTSPPATQATSAAPVLAVYGDGYAAGNELGGLGSAGWPALVAQRTGATLSLHAVSQAGYAAQGVTGQDFPALVKASPERNAAVTVLFGSRNDEGDDPAVVQACAAQTISTLKANAPGMVVIVIGPVWSDAAAPAPLRAIRDAVQDAAGAAGVQFVDPLALGWFARPSGLIAADGVSPTDAGNAYLASQIAPFVTAALAAGHP
jgi:hypothetical protein